MSRERRRITEDLQKFKDEFKLKTMVPEDILHVITNNSTKRTEIRRKAEVDSQSPTARSLRAFGVNTFGSSSCDIPTQADDSKDFVQTIHELREFYATLKLKLPIPEDILSIVTKDVNKQNALREKSLVDAQLPSARLISPIANTVRSKTSDILEGHTVHGKSVSSRRQAERSLTMNLSMLEVKRLIERGFQSPIVDDYHFSPKSLVSQEQRGIVASQELFEILARLDEKGVHDVFRGLPPDSLKVVADAAQFVLNDDGISEDRHRFAVYILHRAIDCSGELPEGIVYDSEVRRDSENPLAGGGFADVFKGTLLGDEIAMKVPRVFDLDTQKNIKIKKVTITALLQGCALSLI